jgi:hypothetical protein
LDEDRRVKDQGLALAPGLQEARPAALQHERPLVGLMQELPSGGQAPELSRTNGPGRARGAPVLDEDRRVKDQGLALAPGLQETLPAALQQERLLDGLMRG